MQHYYATLQRPQALTSPVGVLVAKHPVAHGGRSRVRRLCRLHAAALRWRGTLLRPSALLLLGLAAALLAATGAGWLSTLRLLGTTGAAAGMARAMGH